VLGSEVPAKLETTASALLGQSVLLGGVPFTVIGVLEETGSVGMQNPNDDVLVPLSTAQYRVTGSDRLESMDVQIRSGSAVEQALVDVERILRREHRIRPGEDNDFGILDRKQFLEVREETTRIFALLLPAIAGVSLVVGGIGIMNIMLVSVTERTKEIGLRKALGAHTGDVLLQFLIESLVLTLLGGLIGIAISYGLALLVQKIPNFPIDLLIGADSVIMAVGVSAGCGLIFGLYPAMRATRLDPIEALRYE
jgi:putative ABC transport system permease protein